MVQNPSINKKYLKSIDSLTRGNMVPRGLTTQVKSKYFGKKVPQKSKDTGPKAAVVAKREN